MSKISESKQVVVRYSVPVGGGEALEASVQLMSKSKNIYVSVWQGKELPFNLINEIGRPLAESLHQLLGEILEDHPE